MTDMKTKAEAIVGAFNGYHELVNRRVKIAAALREVINQLQQSSATHPAFISCPDLLELCEEIEKL